MPSSYAAAWATASAAIDTVFGETFAYQPMSPSPSGGRPVADSTRPAMTITGALTERPVFAFPETRSRRASVVAQEATEELSIDISKEALPYEARSGDRLTQLASGAVFEVNGPQPDGIARIELRVYRRSGAP